MLGIADRITTARVDHHATEHGRGHLAPAGDRIDDRTVRLVTDGEPGRPVRQQRRAFDPARTDRNVIVEQLHCTTAVARRAREHDAGDDRSRRKVDGRRDRRDLRTDEVVRVVEPATLHVRDVAAGV